MTENYSECYFFHVSKMHPKTMAVLNSPNSSHIRMWSQYKETQNGCGSTLWALDSLGSNTQLLWNISQLLKGIINELVVLTYENDYNQAKLIKVNVWIGKSITERCIDDHQEHTAANSTKRRLLSLKPLLDVSSDNLKHSRRRERKNQQVASFQRTQGAKLGITK